MKVHNLLNSALELEVENNTIKIVEEQLENNTLKNVNITHLPKNVFAFGIDKKDVQICKGKNNCSDGNKGQCRNQFLNEENNKVNKSCDCIIFYYDRDDNGEYLDLFFCELKSKKLKPINYETQLINTKLFVDYLLLLFGQFYSTEEIRIRKIKYILFRIDRMIQTNRAVRGNVEIEHRPTTENMKNYQEKIIKCPLQKTTHNNVSWEDLVTDFA